MVNHRSGPFSGKFQLRLKPELHKQISIIAGSTGVSVNQFVTSQLQAVVANEYPGAPRPPHIDLKKLARSENKLGEALKYTRTHASVPRSRVATLPRYRKVENQDKVESQNCKGQKRRATDEKGRTRSLAHRTWQRVQILPKRYPRQRSEQLVECDWQFSNAFACGVEDGVRDRCRNTDHSNFAQSLGAQRVDDVILFVDENYFNLTHIRINGDVIFRQIGRESELMIASRIRRNFGTAPSLSRHREPPGTDPPESCGSKLAKNDRAMLWAIRTRVFALLAIKEKPRN